MGQNFLPCDRDQELLLPPSLREWLAEDHLAWFVLDAVGELDLEAFYASYRRDGWGAAAHDPAMMVALLVYAYAIGERSARGVERRCREDVAFRVITANQVPDHATVARFRVRHEAALGELFGQILGLCADAGLVSVGVVAVDGSKFAAAASDNAVRSYEQIAAEIIEEAGQIDAAEDELHGPARGDELPEHLTSREGRRAWLREARQRLERERAQRAEPVTRGRAERLRACQRRLVEDWRAERFANRDYEAHWQRGVFERGRKQMGSGPAPHTPPPRPEGKLNTTDPDAKRMKQGRVFIPAYNAQAVTTDKQIVIAAELTTEGVDFDGMKPLTAEALAARSSPPTVHRISVGARATCCSPDSHTFVCRTWDDLAAGLVWARQEGYVTAKARRANGYVDRPLLPSEQSLLVEAATRLAFSSRNVARIVAVGVLLAGP
jgi:transposase